MLDAEILDAEMVVETLDAEMLDAEMGVEMLDAEKHEEMLVGMLNA